MNFLKILISVIFVFSLTMACNAQEDTAEATLTFKNPFISVLPKKQAEEASTQAPREISIPEIHEPEVKPPELVITGLVWNTPKPQAIINAKVVSIGDSIEEATIMSIHSQSVEIDVHGKRFTILANKALATKKGEALNDVDSRAETETYTPY